MSKETKFEQVKNYQELDKKLSEHQLENLQKNVENIDTKEKLTVFKWLVDTMFEDYKNSKNLYAKCIKELIDIKYLNDIDYIETAKEIVNYYNDRKSGKIYYDVKYINDYRKEHYKQLNVDVPIPLMEKFEYTLKQKKQSKKEFIVKSISEYVNEKEKK